VSGLLKDIPGKLDILLGGHAPPAHDNAAHYSLAFGFEVAQRFCCLALNGSSAAV